MLLFPPDTGDAAFGALSVLAGAGAGAGAALVLCTERLIGLDAEDTLSTSTSYCLSLIVTTYFIICSCLSIKYNFLGL